MDRPIPHTAPPDWPGLRPGADRFAATIRTDSPEGCAAAIVGLPDDLGVMLNHGRLGAAGGPAGVREILVRYATTYDALRDRPMTVRVYDAGDVTPAQGEGEAALEETHTRVTEALRAVHGLGMVPICIGGGHDLTFPAVRALSQHVGAPVGGVSVDAHLDVRESAGSGMPFRRLIEGGFVDAKRFVVLGAARFVHSQAHADWLHDKGAATIEIDTVLAQPHAVKEAFARTRTGDNPDAPCFVTIDLDAIDASQAPGVSAPNPMGLRVAHAAEAARRAGADPRVKHFDIMEFAPPHDVDGRTARVAALLLLTFVASLQDRWA